MFFCPYRGREVEDADGDWEHVVPTALGGSDDLTIRVEKKANGDLGSSVDAPTLEVYAAKRVKFDLRGHSDQPPLLRMPISIPGLNNHPGFWEVTADNAEIALAPRVEKIPNEKGGFQVSVSGSPVQARSIAAKMRQAHEAKGRVVGPFTETPTKIEQPQIEGTFRADLAAFGRFQIKLVLGLLHWLWGEYWSRSPAAAALRTALWSTTIDELNRNAPESASATPELLNLVTYDHEHLFWTQRMHDGRYGIALLLFGQPGYLLKLDDFGDSLRRGEAIVVTVDVRSKAVRKLSVDDLLLEGRCAFPKLVRQD
jgi:hypothetical protein